MKIKMYDSIYMDMMGHPIVKMGYYKKRISFNKKRKFKYITCVSDEFHNFKIKGSDKDE